METPSDKPDISGLRIDRTKKFDDRPKSGWWRYLVAGAVLAGVIVAYFTLRQEMASATKVKIVLVSTLTGSDAAAELVATGYVVAQRKAEVASKGTGRLAYIAFEEGDRAQAGEIIARLDNDDIQAALDQAKAEVRLAATDTLSAGRDYRRRKKLFEARLISESDLENAESAFQTAVAALDAAIARFRVAEVNLENTYIRAPFAGTILSKNADVGEMVTPFASSASSKGSVMTLADMGSLEVEADVSEANIYKVSVGQRCEIVLDAYPQTRYVAHVKKIVPTADRSRATVITKVAFDSIDNRVLPEMSARVNFFIRESKPVEENADTRALVVPKEVLTMRAGARVAFRVDGDKVSQVALTVGRELGGVVEILSGLVEGDRVVLSPAGKMESGQKVEIVK